MSKVAYKTGHGVLITIAAFLMLSVMFRLGSVAGPAFAKEISAESQTISARIEPEVMPPEALDRLISDIRAREAAVEERELKFADRMQALDIANGEIDKRLEELVAAEESLKATLAVAESALDTDIASLTTVYESMKPKDAAAVFSEMAPEFAAGFLAQMRPEMAANILSGLAPETAYAVSVLIAGRNANVPRE